MPPLILLMIETNEKNIDLIELKFFIVPCKALKVRIINYFTIIQKRERNENKKPCIIH